MEQQTQQNSLQPSYVRTGMSQGRVYTNQSFRMSVRRASLEGTRRGLFYPKSSLF